MNLTNCVVGEPFVGTTTALFFAAETDAKNPMRSLGAPISVKEKPKSPNPYHLANRLIKLSHNLNPSNRVISNLKSICNHFTNPTQQQIIKHECKCCCTPLQSKTRANRVWSCMGAAIGGNIPITPSHPCGFFSCDSSPLTCRRSRRCSLSARSTKHNLECFFMVAWI